MKRNLHKLFSKAKQVAFVFASTMLASSSHAQVSYTLTYTGGVQNLTLTPGNWGIQCWGANGGSITTLGGGGVGGYAAGEYSVNANTPISIYVGGVGNPATGTSASAGSGGWNGGGGGSSVGLSGAGGGGGTDVRAGGILPANRVIVAGGGGGAAYYSFSLNSNFVAVGGNGGGNAGQNGNSINSAGAITAGGGGAGANGATPGGAAVATANGLACGAGGGASSAGSSVGQPGTCGGNGGTQGPSAGGSTGSAGGGGGGYAGGAGGVQTNNAGVAGGGGSSYIGGVSSGTTAMTGQANFVAKPITTPHGLVIIRELCNINITAAGVNSLNTICTPNSVTLTTNAVSNFNWSTGNTTNSVIIVTPTANTVYSVSGTSSLNCTAAASFTVLVNGSVPSLTVANTASATSGICPGSTVVLTASGAPTYSWTSPAVNGVAFAPANSGTYQVTGANACGSSTAAVSISIHPVPNVSAVPSANSICTNAGGVSITGVGNAVTYTLLGAPGANVGQTFFPSATNTYTVVGSNALTCTNSAVTSVTVVTTPLAQPLASPPLICIGSTATLNSTGATNYTWSTGNNTVISNNATVTVNPTSSTIYTLTKSNANCVNTQTMQLFVNNLPSPFAVASPTLVCAGKTSTLTGAGALNYTWTAPNYSSTGTSPLVTPTVFTTYTLTASDGTCVNTTTVSVSTNPNPTVSIAATSTNICFGQTVGLSGSGALSYTWSAVNFTSNPTNTTVAETPTSATMYNLTGINAFNCTTTVNQIVLVRTTPTLNIQTTKPLVCSGAPSNLTVSAIGAPPFSYTWDANAGGGTTTLAIVNPITTSVYTVTGMNSVTCAATQTVLVSVFLPTFAVNNPTSSCLGGTINLQASGAVTYTWSHNGSTFPSVPVSPSGPTVYVVSATSNSLGVSCISSTSIGVTIYQNPTVTAVASRTQICRGEFTDVTASGAVSYAWNTSQTGSTVPVNPINNTTYTVVGTDQNSCIGTATVQVKTSTCVDIEKFGNISGLSVYPNPSNGAITIRGAGNMNLQLFSETGQLVRTFSLNENNQQTIVIDQLQPGIYFMKSEGGDMRQKVVITQ